MAKRAEVSRSSALSSLCGVGGPARHNGLLILVTYKSHDVTIETPTNHISSRRDSFPFRRKSCMNWLSIRYFEKGLEFSNHIKTP